MVRAQSVPFSAIAACPQSRLDAQHFDHYSVDGKCNCGRICGYRDENGGPCILKVDGHPSRAGEPVHDDGVRFEPGKWRR